MGGQEKNFEKLSVTENFTHFVTFYDEDGILGRQKAELSKQFNKRLHKMKEETDILVQPLVTLEECNMLKFPNAGIYLKLKLCCSTWYCKNSLSSSCKYIRLALAAGFEIWSRNSLLNQRHGED